MKTNLIYTRNVSIKIGNTVEILFTDDRKNKVNPLQNSAGLTKVGSLDLGKKQYSFYRVETNGETDFTVGYNPYYTKADEVRNKVMVNDADGDNYIILRISDEDILPAEGETAPVEEAPKTKRSRKTKDAEAEAPATEAATENTNIEEGAE